MQSAERSELRSAKQAARAHAEAGCDLQDRGERDVELAALDRPVVAAVQSHVRGERLLHEPLFSAGRPDRLAKRTSRYRLLGRHGSPVAFPLAGVAAAVALLS